MEGFKTLVLLIVELYQLAYEPNESGEAVVVDQDAANRLQRLDDEILYLARGIVMMMKAIKPSGGRGPPRLRTICTINLIHSFGSKSAKPA